jgi:hypothetical protein
MVRVGLRRPSASLPAHVISSWQCPVLVSATANAGGLAEDLQYTPGGRGFGCPRAVWRPGDGHAPDHVGGRAQVELLEAVACLPRELVSVRGTWAAVDAARYAQVPRFVHCGSEAALLAGDPLVDVDETTPLRPEPCPRQGRPRPGLRGLTGLPLTCHPHRSRPETSAVIAGLSWGWRCR